MSGTAKNKIQAMMAILEKDLAALTGEDRAEYIKAARECLRLASTNVSRYGRRYSIDGV